MTKEGYNPIRKKCRNGFCWNEAHRFRIELFAECLTGKCAMTDIDATAEQFGRFLFLEFKSHEGPLSYGQKIYFERLTKISKKITVFVVCADVTANLCYSMLSIYNGKINDWKPCDLDGLKAEIYQWRTRSQHEHALEIST
jgi:hypothetical protein